MEMRSRVTPGTSWTMLIRFPYRAFSRLLLPTFGRPTIATVGMEDIGGTIPAGVRVVSCPRSVVRGPLSVEWPHNGQRTTDKLRELKNYLASLCPRIA